MGQNSILALHRLLANAEKEGWSPKKIHEQCKLAVDGEYTTKNYSQYEINLTCALYELGGGAAVHAMHKSIFALPCRNTIQPYRRQHKLTPSVSGLKFADITSNIAALFGPHARRETDKSNGVEQPPTICGHTLSFDELATERKIDYIPETDEMGGFCLEHVSVLETVKVGNDTRTVEAAITAVREGKVHISHETSVGAISRLYQTGYGARPVFLGPSCKKGGWKQCVEVMEMVLEAWKRSPHGEQKHGPIFEVSSDGDHKCRVAMFVMCMNSEIGPDNPLYPFICNLPGLNCRVGNNNLTSDPDWKHMDKRWCTLLCSSEGLAVKNVCINRDVLLTWLERLPFHDWSESSIHALLSETSLKALLNPSDAQDVPRAIKLLLCIMEIGKLDPEEFDPSEAAEFEALCLLGELFDAMLQPFINMELSLSEQIQSLIKFSHLLCALYIQNGTSFIPNQLYADLQAMVKNAVLLVPKTRILNGSLKVFICLLGDDVLEALFGRLRMIGRHSPNCSLIELRDRFASAMTLDHIFEEHPELERRPRRLNMFRMCHAVEFILAKYGVRMSMSFAQRFKRKDTDLLRPMGGKYPAISPEVDRSLVNSSSPAADTIDPDIVDPLNLMAGVDFDALIAAEKDRSPSSAESHSHFAEIDTAGNLAHKKIILRTFFDMTHDSHASHDRLQRVRGFTIGGKSWTRDNSELSSENVSATTHFQLGNLFTTLLCHNGTHLSLALAKSTLIKRGTSGSKAASVSAIPRAELHLPDSPYAVSGQVLSVVPLAPAENDVVWVWDGDFTSFSLKKKKNNGEEIARIKNLQFSVSSRLIDANIHGQAREISACNFDLPSGREKTWSFSNSDLLAAWNSLWIRILNDTSLHDKFPVFTECRSSCYTSPIANTAIERSIKDRLACRICGKSVKDQDRQLHVGEHILKALKDVEDVSAKTPVSDAYPCGTCGGSTIDGSCKIAIKGGKADSDCPSAYCFMISAARKFRPTRLCMNIPIECALGYKETHWKYNYHQHLQERHPDWKRLISDKFAEEIRISVEEQSALKIPAEKVIAWPILDVASPDLRNGCKRSISSLTNSPTRRQSDKENRTPNASPSRNRSKMPRLY
ncbi:hypothetical protein DFH07DRAFT_778032 [Mycena maculata]|uniref:Uncharacterized protein n=1 Tax=Mycena maculata TaxID=230809 RepID=A0AAD7N0T0_9AGAR|nr:hypothetical protein DFH07DRAFT_778032 [Mycena maculata]